MFSETVRFNVECAPSRPDSGLIRRLSTAMCREWNGPGALATDPSHRCFALLPNFECGFDCKKISGLTVIGVLFDGSASPCESTTACRADSIFRENLPQCVRELAIKCRNVGAAAHDYLRLATRPPSRWRAASGHISAPPSSVMNSRRLLIRSPRRHARAQLELSGRLIFGDDAPERQRNSQRNLIEGRTIFWMITAERPKL